MTTWQIALIVGLLAVIASTLVTISKQIDRLIRVMSEQQERIQKALSHPDDNNLRFQLGVFLREANKPAHAATRRQVDEFLGSMRSDQDEVASEDKATKAQNPE